MDAPKPCHTQAPSPFVILSGAKDLEFSLLRNEKRPEMFRKACPACRAEAREGGSEVEGLDMTAG